MEGRKQLPAEEVIKGRHIAPVRIHMGRAFGRNHSKGNTASVYDSTCQPDSLCVCLARNTSSQLLLPFLNMNSLTKRLKAITRVYMRVTTMRTKKTVKMNYN